MGICKIQKVEIFGKLYTFVWIVSIHLLTDSGMRNKLRWKYLVRFKLSIVFSVVNAKSEEKFPSSSRIAHDAFIRACTYFVLWKKDPLHCYCVSLFCFRSPHPCSSSGASVPTLAPRTLLLYQNNWDPARLGPGPHTLIFIKILLRPWAHSHRQIARQWQ